MTPEVLWRSHVRAGFAKQGVFANNMRPKVRRKSNVKRQTQDAPNEVFLILQSNCAKSVSTLDFVGRK